MTSNSTVAATPLAAVIDVLSRISPVDALSALENAMRLELEAAELDQTVIAFDANVFLRLANHRRSEDIVDFLRTSFPGKLILPGQVVQEFWNNQFLAVDTQAIAIRKKADELRSLVEKIDAGYGDYATRFTGLLDEFNEDYGHVFDEQTLRRTGNFVSLLSQKALVPFAPRVALAQCAMVRKRTKTPPGFKDDLDGDFFVWSDLLLGLALLKESGNTFSRVILVTLDKKLDWSRGSIPHPLLSAEIAALCSASFELLTIDGLAQRLLD